MSKDQGQGVDQPTLNEIESIMGQYIFAAGAGASSQWIRRHAILFLRERYRSSIESALQAPDADWCVDAPRILHYLEIIGRLAADIATQAGRDCIDRGDMERAVVAVESHYKHRIEELKAEEGAGPVSEGRWCQ